MTVPAVLEGITAGLETGDAEHRAALDRALASVRDYAEVLDDLRPPGTVTADLDASLGPGPASCSYLIALTQIAHEMITAHCLRAESDSYPCLPPASESCRARRADRYRSGIAVHAREQTQRVKVRQRGATGTRVDPPLRREIQLAEARITKG